MVAGFEYVSPAPGQAQNDSWVDIGKFDKNDIFGPDSALAWNSYPPFAG